MVYFKEWGLIKVTKKLKIAKIREYAAGFTDFGAFRGGYKEGVNAD